MPFKEFDVSGLGKIKVYKRKNNRSLRLTIAADGGIRVSIPLWTPYQAAVAFALSKRTWILAQSSHPNSLLSHGCQIGKFHHLLFIHDPDLHGIKTSLRKTEIIIRYGGSYTVESADVQIAAQAVCTRALRLQAHTLLSQRLAQLAQARQLEYKSLTIKRLKSRWGSCDQDGNIVLNLYLVQLPWQFIDYVILHELAHTKVLHHGPQFWRQMEALHPEAGQLRKAIKMYRPRLAVT